MRIKNIQILNAGLIERAYYFLSNANRFNFYICGGNSKSYSNSIKLPFGMWGQLLYTLFYYLIRAKRGVWLTKNIFGEMGRFSGRIIINLTEMKTER